MLYLLAVLLPVLWALCPVVVRTTQGAFAPYWAFALRAMVAASISLPLLVWIRWRSWEKSRAQFSSAWLGQAVLTGPLLYGSIFLANHSLHFTTVGKAVFYASCYAILVPLWKSVVMHQPLSPMGRWSIVLATLGLGSISGFNLLELNGGDLIALGSALCFTAYMLMLEAAPQLTAQPFMLNAVQNLVIAPLAIGLAYGMEGSKNPLLFLISGSVRLEEVALPWGGILVLGIFVSWLSCVLQVYVQNKLPSHVVGVILLLDSPLACFGAYVLLGENPAWWTVAGGVLIFFASLLMVASRWQEKAANR
jgi:drug/metabolite transporter (DMT)-like permease